MNNEVIARIDISTPEGREIVQKLEQEESVTLEYPETENADGKKWYSVEEVFSKLEEDLNKHFGSSNQLKY